MIGVYEILNTKDEKRYIGSSLDVDRRISCHKYLLSNNRHFNGKLQNAWNKYGEDCFEFNVLVECTSEELLHVEKHYIEEYRTLHKSSGYNIAPDPNRGSAGISWNKESRNKLSSTLKSMYESGARKPTRTTHTQETRKAISDAVSGQAAHNKKAVWCHQTRTEYDSIHSAAHVLSVSVSGVHDVIHGKIRSIRGLTFEYADCSTREHRDKVFMTPKVLCVEYNIEFNNQTEAANFIGVKSGDLGRAIRERNGRCKGYTFAYI